MEDFPRNSVETPQSSFARRQATDEDIDFARRIHHAAMHDVVVRQFGSWNEEEQNEFFARSWHVAGTEIISDEGTEVGYCVIEDSSTDIYLSNIFIDPAFQGKGIGTQILQELITKAKARNIPVYLQVFKENQAHELYERLGFKDVEESDTRYVMVFQPNQGIEK